MAATVNGIYTALLADLGHTLGTLGPIVVTGRRADNPMSLTSEQVEQFLAVLRSVPPPLTPGIHHLTAGG